MNARRLFSYVVAYDTGAAPNPFWGYCTLAICKPVIRRVARAGDWVVGIGPASGPTRGKLIYALRVDEILTLDEYYRDVRFARKIPDDSAPDARRRVGDNVYFLHAGRYRKHPGGTHTAANLDHDIGGKNVLASRHYYYFGEDAVEVPERLERITQGGQGHRSWFPATYIEMLEEWLPTLGKRGVRGRPIELDKISCRQT